MKTDLAHEAVFRQAGGMCRCHQPSSGSGPGRRRGSVCTSGAVLRSIWDGCSWWKQASRELTCRKRGRRAGGMEAVAAKCTAQLRDVVALVRGELAPLQRATLGVVVVMDVHARDVAAELAAQRVADVAAFAWQSQLRTYWEARAQPCSAPASWHADGHDQH